MSDKKEYLTPVELSARWDGNIQPQTLTGWRKKGMGPKFSKFENKILYKISDIEKYEALNQHGGKNV